LIIRRERNMDRTAFADTEAEPRWWLLLEEIDYALVEPRKALSVALGYDREAQWYLEKWKLEGLYDALEAQARPLLTELDEATDEYKRKEWLEKAVAAVKPATVGGKEDHTPSRNPSSPPATAASPQAATAAAAPAAKPRAFGTRKAEAGSPEAASPEAPTPATAAAAPSKPDLFAKAKEAKAEKTVTTALDEALNDDSKLNEVAGVLGASPEETRELLEDPEFKNMLMEEMRAG
jgi:hypothetical protein